MAESLSSNQSLMYGCGGELETTFLESEGIFYAVFLLMQFVMSTFGNILVCLAILRFPSLHTLTNAFILSLSITDLLTPGVRVIYVAVSIFASKWIFGCFWCQLSSVLGVFLCSSSILHLCVISVERFITIKWPLRHQNWITKRSVAFLITNIWVVSFVLSLFPYFGLVHHTFNIEILDCEIWWEANPKLAVLLAIFFFLIPFMVMSLTYFYIFKEVHRQTRRVSTVPVPAEMTRKKSIGSRMRINHILKHELKAVRIIVVVIGVFFVFWLPWFTVTCIRAYSPKSISGMMQRLTFAMAYTNSSCNWIIYSVMNRQIREAFKTILTSCQSRLPQPKRGSDAPKNIRNVFSGIRIANVAFRRASKSETPTTESNNNGQNPQALQQQQLQTEQ
ncbi:D(2) dopamine receptor-like [Rhopilema esculentum]|uniref:D(2) dopamine receptor-like n=1 Tax=Rhopilema esculentum TaxID=499914 RepID=UPI0031DF893D|eukprot:gene16236-7613_t